MSCFVWDFWGPCRPCTYLSGGFVEKFGVPTYQCGTLFFSRMRAYILARRLMTTCAFSPKSFSSTNLIQSNETSGSDCTR
mgnify:CR=1 FL=1